MGERGGEFTLLLRLFLATNMPRDPLIEAEVQKVLNDLWSEKLIPFQLNVGKITKEPEGFTIHFYDSRIYTVFVPQPKPESFSDAVRSVVLDRVSKMSGPLKQPGKIAASAGKKTRRRS